MSPPKMGEICTSDFYNIETHLHHITIFATSPYLTGVIDAQAHILDGSIGTNDIFSVGIIGSLDKSNDGGF